MPQRTATDDPCDLKAYGQADSILCYLLLGSVFAYASGVYIRERFHLRKAYTLRTFILLLTSLNCLLLLAYTAVSRNFTDIYAMLFGNIGDVVITSVAFYQYYFVVRWFSRISAGQDDEFLFLYWCVFTKDKINMVGHATVVSYIVVATVLMSLHRFDVFQVYQDVVDFSFCIGFFVAGLWFAFKVHLHTNTLDISPESYAVIRRLRYTIPMLSLSAMLACTLCGMSLFMADEVEKFTNIFETRYYTCSSASCLVTFLLRVLFLITMPNAALSFTFSSPSQQSLHLVPLSRSTSKYAVNNNARSPLLLNLDK